MKDRLTWEEDKCELKRKQGCQEEDIGRGNGKEIVWSYEINTGEEKGTMAWHGGWMDDMQREQHGGRCIMHQSMYVCVLGGHCPVTHRTLS